MIKPNKQQIIQALRFLESDEKSIVKTAGPKKFIDKTYNGYIAAFGGTVVQMGLFPAVMLYHNDKREGTCRRHITTAIFELYKKNHQDITANNLFEFLRPIAEPEQVYKVRSEIMQIALALKMAIRSYELKELEDAKNLSA
ncbi:MAG: hypothetical protein AAFP19_17400 [Bacteroidota bacterium]